MAERRIDRKNPKGMILPDRKKRATLDSVERLDRSGRLYRMAYTAAYTGGLTSLTQYSAVYHLKKRTVSVFLRDRNGDFSEAFEFDIR